MSTDKEFYDLLSSIVEDQTFTLDLFAKETPVTVSCKQLTTAQLKELVKTAVDSPLTQSVFNTTVAKVFTQSMINAPKIAYNIIDRLLFVLETRIQSFSATKEVDHESKKIVINFEKVKSNLKKQLESNKELFASSSATEGKIAISFGIPSLHTEMQMNEELHKNINLEIQDTEELRKIIGEAFINEISKSIQTITIGEKALDLSTISFKQRLKAVETLPASLIQKAIEYIEKYKKVIEDGLTVDGYLIPIDSTLFSVR